MTQPCVVIIGRMDNVACPVPVTVGGEALPDSTARNLGTVIVRWMYPLPASPPPVETSAGSDETGPSAEPTPLPEPAIGGPAAPTPSG
jgi:hypothetical protein